MNKYEKWYAALTKRGQIRIIDDYTENHHILPESLGGQDTPDNITILTAREHFICHWLLTKIYATGDEHWKMLNAIRIMRAENKNQKRYNTKITSRVYAKLKEEYSNLQSKRVSGKNNPMYGDKFYRSAEGKVRQRQAVSGDNNGSKKKDARIKIAESKIGKKRQPFSDKWRENMSISASGENNSMFGKKHSEKTKQKQRVKATGRKQSPETIAKKAEAIRGSKREKKLCPHCQQYIAVNLYERWHNDKCKYKDQK